MMERHDHINPWADKLQDIALPGENGSWEAMEALLDREMPSGRGPAAAGVWKDRRRWVVLIILLLLLVGVCNCPGVRLVGHKEMTGHEEAPGRKESRARADAPGDKKEVSGRVEEHVAGKDSNGVEIRKEHSVIGGGAVKEEPSMVVDSVNGGRSGSRMERRHDDVSAKGKVSDNKEKPVGSGGTGVRPGVRGPAGGGGKDTASDRSKDTARAASKDTASSKAKVPRTKDVLKAGRRTDSTAATQKISRPDSILQMKGWLAGAGLNQFFTVGRQQQSNYNSNGTTGGLSDYIPVPMVRYYFNRKLFVQIEAQFNTPQYTSKNLLASQSKPDSFAVPGRVFQTSLYIQKLFYFNLPLSIHYSPIRDLYAGAGIQYARLTNGVALYQDLGRSIFVGGRDSLASSKVQSFKNDTTYQKLKTNEFRLLLDIDYNFKRFIIGARYNRSLTNFINLPISNTQVTQSRNSSLQVYLRYIIWDGRKKILLPK